jgi:hypothetical protein
VTLPPEAVAAVAGTTEDDAWEVVLPLLTVDEDGFPRVCQLSRAEVDIDGASVRCVVRGRRTTANLRRDRRALLVVVHDVTAYYVRMTVSRAVIDEQRPGALAVEFRIDRVEEDSRHTPLRPMTFLASAWVRTQDHTDGDRGLLDRLSAGAASDGPAVTEARAP